MAVYKHDRAFKLGTTKKQTQLVVRAGFIPGIARVRVQRADHSVTPPPENDELRRSDRLAGNARQDFSKREKTAIEACVNSI